MATATAFLPRIVALGRGTAQSQLRSVLQQCSVSKPFVVTDKNLEALTRNFLDSNDISGEVYADECDEPTSDRVNAMAAALSSSGADGVLAIGGGSPLDAAKLAVVLSENGGKCQDYKAPVLTDTPPALPMVAVPTTAGTGAEVTRYAVVTDSESGEKMLCAGAAFVPAACVVDGSLADGSPSTLTADVGVDALCHAMEAFVSKKSSPLSDGFALDALRGIGHHLRSAVADEAEGRDGMARAAFLAGVSFSVSSVTLIHGMSRPLGARFHLAHGRSNAVLMPAVTAYSLEGARERYAQCSEALGLAGDLPAALHDLASSLGVPSLSEALRERGVDERMFRDAVPGMARDALASGSPANNPLVPSEADVARLYHACYDND